MITLSRATDVQAVLAKRASPDLLAEGLRIKPDLTKEQRDAEHLLLYERRLLIDAGTESRLIRIRGNSLFIGPRRHASVRHGALHKSDSLGDHAHELDEISDRASNCSTPAPHDQVSSDAANSAVHNIAPSPHSSSQ